MDGCDGPRPTFPTALFIYPRLGQSTPEIGTILVVCKDLSRPMQVLDISRTRLKNKPVNSATVNRETAALRQSGQLRGGDLRREVRHGNSRCMPGEGIYRGAGRSSARSMCNCTKKIREMTSCSMSLCILRVSDYRYGCIWITTDLEKNSRIEVILTQVQL